MRKIILFLICFFLYISYVNANSLISEDLPYYVKISKGHKPAQIINVKKIYDKETLGVVFNTDIENYTTPVNLGVYKNHDINIWKANIYSVNYFNTIVYYGYNTNPTDLNYFLTQVLVWELVFHHNVEITDKEGNIIENYNNEYTKILNTAVQHKNVANFFNKEYTKEIWGTDKYQYYDNKYILDNPITDSFNFKNELRNLYIYPERIGTYTLEFIKDFEQDAYCYTDGKNMYWQSLGGPNDIKLFLTYNVYGTKLNIEENLMGINNHFGDAKLNSKYELYLNDALKLIIEDFNNIYVKSNSNYLLKDISNSIGINNIEDIQFEMKDEEYTLIIDKYVISKNISLDIKDDKEYFVYLKSNNELYETVNNTTDMITLPYGYYYIKDLDNSYYREIFVDNNIDELLVIGEINKEEIFQDEVKVEDINKEEINFDLEHDDFTNFEETIPENPQTLDDINDYIIGFIISLFITLVLLITLSKPEA